MPDSPRYDRGAAAAQLDDALLEHEIHRAREEADELVAGRVSLPGVFWMSKLAMLSFWLCPRRLTESADDAVGPAKRDRS